MPPADVAVAKRLYEALEEHDEAALQEVLMDDVEWIVPASLPWGGRRQGVEQVAEGAALLRDSVGHSKLERDEFIDVGDGELIVLGRLIGEGSVTASTIEAEFADHIKVTGGRIARYQAYIDTAEILKGLAEPPAD
jgi:ketosteroid isomerase-like protein